MFIEELNNEWRDLRKKLKDNRRHFDDEWRDKHRSHDCDTKVHSESGEWFCEHLTLARNKHFKEDANRIDDVVHSIISLSE